MNPEKFEARLRKRPTAMWWQSFYAMVLALGSLTLLFTIGFSVYRFAVTLKGFSLLDSVFGGLGVGVMVSVFALVGWLVFVLPLTLTRRTRRWLVHPRFAELIWAFLGALSFNVTLQPFVFAWDVLLVSWIPALIGATAGFFFRRLVLKQPFGPPRPQEEMSESVF